MPSQQSDLATDMTLNPISPQNYSRSRSRGNMGWQGEDSPMNRSSRSFSVNRMRKQGRPFLPTQSSTRRNESVTRSRLALSGGRGEPRPSLTCQFSPKRTDSEVKVHTAFSIGAVHRVFSSFRGEKKKIIESIGFGGLIKIQPQPRLPRLLVLWLVRNMDPVTGTIRLPNGEELTVAAEDVELVLGLPRKSKIIQGGMTVSQSDVTKIKKYLMIRKGQDITLTYLEKLLMKDYGTMMSTREREAFKIAAVLYADAYFLAPKGNKAKVNHDLFRYISDTAFIDSLDWCDYVLKVLIDSTSRAKEALNMGDNKVTLDGCLFFWVVYYIDNIESGGSMNSHCQLPRVVDFPYTKVKELVGDDKCKTGVPGAKSFGQNKLRPAKEVIYSRNKDNKLRSEEMKKVAKCNSSTMESGKYSSADACKIVGIIETWSNNINNATVIARQALLSCVNTEDGTTMSTERHKDDDPTECVNHAENAEETHPGFEGKKIIDLVSDEEMEKSEDDDGDSTPNLQTPEHTVGVSEQEIDQDEIKTYECLMIRRLSAIGLLEETDGRHDQANYPLTQTMGAMGMQLSTLVLTDAEVNNTTTNEKKQHRAQMGTIEMEVSTIVLEAKGIEKETHESTDYEQIGATGMELSPFVAGADDVQTPKPLCVVRSDDCVSKANVVTIVTEDELILDESYMDPNSKFGISPFTINLTHKDTPLFCQLRLERDLKNQSDEDKKRTWYRHNRQNQHNPIEISGAFLQKMFTDEYDLTMAAVNGIVKLFQEMDNEMYAKWRQRRWRHFMPVEFAVISLNGFDINNTLQAQQIAEMFLSSTINYRVNECRMIFAPLMVDLKWSMYAWDFEKNRVLVLDPNAMHVDRDVMDQKHRRYVELMHRTMLECWKLLFAEPFVNGEQWDTEYIRHTGASCESYNTGIYTMFYTRYFDGEFITRILSKGASRLEKLNMLYQMLAMDGNTGDPPAWIVKLDTNNRALLAQW